MKFKRTFLSPLFFMTLYTIGLPVVAQQNLIRNPSFENGPSNKPDQLTQLHKANRWRHFRGTTSDWYKHAGPDYLRGRNSCGFQGHGLLLNPVDTNLIPLRDGIAYAGTIKWDYGTLGEGLQQKLQHKLDRGIYELSFWYLQPCSRRDYQFSFYLSNSVNDLDHLVYTVPLDTNEVGVWREFKRTFFIDENNLYDWFLILFEGSEGTVLEYPAYMYYDDFHLTKIECADCSPSGAISWNPAVPDHFMPNFDGVRTYPMDYWCISNVNNVMGIDFYIIAGWDNVIYERHYFDPNGIYDFDLCWDGTFNDEAVHQLGLNSFVGVARFYNCNEEVRYDSQYNDDILFTMIPFLPNVDGIYVNQFTIQPEPWGQLTLPNAPPYQHLYGGNWDGFHNWYACDEIFTGGNENTHVQYFRAGVNSTARLYAGNAIVLGPGTFFDFGSNVVVKPDTSIRCCPELRTAPSAPEHVMEPLALDTFPELEVQPTHYQEICPYPFINAFPNPVEEVLSFQAGCLPEDSKVEIEILDLQGRLLLLAGMENNTLTLSLGDIPAGVYLWRAKAGTQLFSGKVVKSSN